MNNPAASGHPLAQGVAPRVLVVMGVSGSGKTTIAEGLHNVLGWPYQEGDLLHPAANIEKMASGIALSDEDRVPWLAQCRAWIDACQLAGGGGILTCSALKRHYRDALRAGGADVLFIYLKIPQSVIEARLAHRHGHYMPASLLGSQFALLEEPMDDEAHLTVLLQHSPAETIATITGALRERDPD